MGHPLTSNLRGAVPQSPLSLCSWSLCLCVFIPRYSLSVSRYFSLSVYLSLPIPVSVSLSRQNEWAALRLLLISMKTNIPGCSMLLNSCIGSTNPLNSYSTGSRKEVGLTCNRRSAAWLVGLRFEERATEDRIQQQKRRMSDPDG